MNPDIPTCADCRRRHWPFYGCFGGAIVRLKSADKTGRRSTDAAPEGVNAMPKTTTKELRDNARCKRLTIHALCPHCDSDITELEGDDTGGGTYDNAHDKGRGGYRVRCHSCGEPFVIEQDAVNNVQHIALVLLGEG